MSIHFSGGRRLRLPLLLLLICLLALPLSPTFIQASGGAQETKFDAQAAQRAAQRQAARNRVRELTSHSTKGLKFEKLRNGASFMRAQGRFQHVMLSRRNANGSLSAQCVGSVAEADAFLSGANPIETDAPSVNALRGASASASSSGSGVNLLANAAAPSSVSPPNRATIVIVNADGPNEGFNDPTPVAPVGGNPGTTLGQQRLFVFQRAAEIWGAALQSRVPIFLEAQFDPVGADSGILAFAGPTGFFIDVPNEPVPNTIYPFALANRLAGADQFPTTPPTPQISATANSDFDFYNGLDNNAPVGGLDLLTVVLHEFAHGLGFLSLVDNETGRRPLADDANPDGGLNDIYSLNLFDVTLGLSWPNMTAAQRLFSATNDGNLTWNGPNVTSVIPGAFRFKQIVRVNGGSSPTSFELSPIGFGAPFRTPGVTANVVSADPALACGPLNNPAALSGRIALIDRGGCALVDKARAAQAAGAVGALIVNNVPGTPPNFSGFEQLFNVPDVTIPVAFISQAGGNALRAQLAGGVNATLTLDLTQRAGTTNGRVRMFAPNPSQGGSSVSHWDTSAVPRILMEPALNPGIPQTLDLTIPHFRDLGWYVAGAPAPASNRVSLMMNSSAAAPGATAGCLSGYTNVITVNATLRNTGQDTLLAPFSMTALQLVKRGVDLDPGVPYRLSSADGFNCAAVTGPTSGIPGTGGTVRQTLGASSLLPSSVFPGGTLPDNGVPVQFTIAAGVVQRFFILLSVDAVTPQLTPMTASAAKRTPTHLGNLALEVNADPKSGAPTVTAQFIPAAGAKTPLACDAVTATFPNGLTATMRPASGRTSGAARR
jgi:hypothetical protein